MGNFLDDSFVEESDSEFDDTVWV